MSDFNSRPFKLSDGNEYTWEEVWNGLYYNFIKKHSNLLKSIYSTAIQVKNLNNLSSKEIRDLVIKSKFYIHTYGYKKIK